jgi:basic membrane protein A
MNRLAVASIAFGSIMVLAASAGTGAERLKVGLVIDVLTKPSTHDLRGLQYLGFLRAVKELGVQGRVVQINPKHGAADALASLGRQKYDLVFTGLAGLLEVRAAARRFPGTRFLIPVRFEDLKGMPKNVQGEHFRTEQAGYLAGYLAALMEKRRPGKDVIGSVGGFPFSGVDLWIAGYEAAAHRADPGITLLRRYSNDFHDSAKCKAVALSEISRGAGVVFQVAGLCGLGTLEAAKEKRIWGIGVDGDESYLGPHILTSAMGRDDLAVYRAIKLLTQGRLRTGGNYIYDLANGSVGLGKISPKVPRAFLRELDRIRAQIIAGKIKVPTTLR